MSGTDPTRPPTKGAQKTKVVSNFCRIEEVGAKHIYSYKVSITDQSAEGQAGSAGRPALSLPTAVKREIFAKVAVDSKVNGKYVFYPGNEFAYSPKSLHKKSSSSKDQQDEKPEAIVAAVTHTLGVGDLAGQRRLRVTLAFQRRYETKLIKKYCKGDTSVPDMYMHEVMYIFDNLFRVHPMTRLKFLANSYVTDQYSIHSVAGFDINWGYQQTVRPGEKSLYLNIHTKPVPIITSDTLREAALMFSKSKTVKTLRDMTGKDWSRFLPVMRSLQVSIPGNTQIVLTGLSHAPAKQEEYEGMPVAKYYSDKFGITVKDLDLPCAVTALGVPVPLELCKILPGQLQPRLSGQQLNQLCLLGAASPALREKVIAAGVKELEFENNPDLKAFGIRVSPKLEVFKARVLPPPDLLMNDGEGASAVEVKEGKWEANGLKVVDATKLRSWAVVCFASQKMYPQALVTTFVHQLVKVCTEIGMTVPNVEPPIKYASFNTNIAQTISNACQLAKNASRGEQAQLILCVLPNASASLYGEIKRVATTVVGVQTQCIQASNIGAFKPKILKLVALKINVKLGGYTSELADKDRPCISERPTMVISADVNHATEAGNMSVGAILSSLDLQCKRFQGIVMQHPKRMEFIENFDVIIRQCLRLFYKNTQKKPERILYYRDGVGDATMPKVNEIELQAIYKGCALLDPSYKPKVTVILVRKRHHVRFLPSEGSEHKCSSEGNYNCLPGTAVDSGAVIPSLPNFYLLSHVTKSGTARPPYFIVLHDDSKFEKEKLKTLTYNLSFTYPIVLKSATMPAPLYYAHRLTNQGRFQLNLPFNSLPKFTAKPDNNNGNNSNRRGNGQATSQQRSQQQPKPHLVPVHKHIQDTMYFM
ncbi:hypothetical protein GGI12_002395 [Dipsacomyces acuminosporus]|nr:hypothetical protein GGI12_002395 [Dipsacomyces acuminosporus]